MNKDECRASDPAARRGKLVVTFRRDTTHVGRIVCAVYEDGAAGPAHVAGGTARMCRTAEPTHEDMAHWRRVGPWTLAPLDALRAQWVAEAEYVAPDWERS